MDLGYLFSNRNLFWSPKPDIYRWYVPSAKEGELAVLPFAFFGAKREAHLCPNCKTCIMDLSKAYDEESSAE